MVGRHRLREVAGRPDTWTAHVVLAAPGYYQVVAEAGGLSASACVVAVDSPKE
ncbi:MULTISPECIES: hypothetical protein [unclassified Streptomyces]|uniref:hypothetical protein n=1 Tax=unclassified Streptomyces TaxID=2593676 RepID=UPI003450E2DD